MFENTRYICHGSTSPYAMRGDIFRVRIPPYVTSQWLITRPCMRNAGNSLVNHKGILYAQHQQVKVSYCYLQNNF